jgi:DNA invertase Pin-like site-specific DNA recombinase
MMIFGYARVSTEEQNLNMQIDSLTRFGVEKMVLVQILEENIKKRKISNDCWS